MIHQGDGTVNKSADSVSNTAEDNVRMVKSRGVDLQDSLRWLVRYFLTRLHSLHCLGGVSYRSVLGYGDITRSYPGCKRFGGYYDTCMAAPRPAGLSYIGIFALLRLY